MIKIIWLPYYTFMLSFLFCNMLRVSAHLRDLSRVRWTLPYTMWWCFSLIVPALCNWSRPLPLPTFTSSSWCCGFSADDFNTHNRLVGRWEIDNIRRINLNRATGCVSKWKKKQIGSKLKIASHFSSLSLLISFWSGEHRCDRALPHITFTDYWVETSHFSTAPWLPQDWRHVRCQVHSGVIYQKNPNANER